MKSMVGIATLFLSEVLLAGSVLAVTPASPAPSTAEVLGKLHSVNVKEFRMGKMANAHGSAKDVRTYGDTVVDDHDALDTQVCALAKDEGIVLAAHTPAVVM